MKRKNTHNKGMNKRNKRSFNRQKAKARKDHVLLGDLNIMRLNYKPPHDIVTKIDLEKLNRKIESRIRIYSMETLLLMIHDSYLAERNPPFPPFVAGMMTKYALLNCDVDSGYPIYDREEPFTYEEEFLELRNMIYGYSAYDPELIQESILMKDRDKWASFILRKIGSQTRWNIPLHNMLGRTMYLFGELAKSNESPIFIKDLVISKFEEMIGISLLDFIKIGFVLFAGSNRPNGLTRNYFEIAREKKIPIPSDEIINKCLEQVACYPEQFKKLCQEYDLGEENLRAYKFNPLFLFPIIRPWMDSHLKEQKEDRFIAPIPELVIYRFTIGLYYQLFSTFKLDFSKSFGALFELYIGKILEWYKLPGIVISESDLSKYLPNYKGKRPDWIIFCNEGIIFIECKATKYSQDIYEHGISAKYDSKGCVRQVQNAIAQLNEFETQIPLLCDACNLTHQKKEIIKLIVTFEQLLGLKKGPIRDWVEEDKKNEGYKMDWKLIWVGELEEIQPHISKGVNFWNFLTDFWEKDLGSILKEMELKTGSSYAEGILYQYEKRIFDELLNNMTPKT